MWRESLEKEINELIKQAEMLVQKDFYNELETYQEWYSKACRIIKLVIPERYDEFISYYEGFKHTDRSGIFNFFTQKDNSGYRSFVAERYFSIQCSVLKACLSVLDPFYQNINKQIYFEYQEDDLKIAEKLMRISIRAAGALAGFVLEKHLKIVCNNHLLSGMENKTLGQLIDTLHQNKVINTTDRKNLEYLSDTRNKCDHAKKEEPKEYEVKDLIEHTRRWIALLN